MPKQKTHKGVKKRFRVTARGKVKHRRAGTSHLQVRLTSKRKRKLRDFLEEYTLPNGRRVYLLGEGRLVNLAVAEGHPAMVMDMSFANQALAVEYLVKNRGRLKPQVYNVPADLDREIARTKLASMGIEIDRLTPAQEKYLSAWEEGT